MLTYEKLSHKPKEFLCATSLEVAEFERLLPAFAEAYRILYPVAQTLAGQVRQRKAGGGSKGQLVSLADKLLFILIYEKTYPLQTMHGLAFNLSQGRVNYWIHHLLPVLRQALATLHMTPEREGSVFAASAVVADAPADFLIDGSERRRQRPKDAQQQVEQYSGKKSPYG